MTRDIVQSVACGPASDMLILLCSDITSMEDVKEQAETIQFLDNIFHIIVCPSCSEKFKPAFDLFNKIMDSESSCDANEDEKSEEMKIH